MGKKQSKQKGSALLFSLILVLVLSVMGASLMFLSQSETWSSINYRMMSQARYGAESGLSVAGAFIVNKYSPPTASGADALGIYNRNVSPMTSNGPPVSISPTSDPLNNTPQPI